MINEESCIRVDSVPCGNAPILIAEIGPLAVALKQQGKGIGTGLMKQAHLECESSKITQT